MPIPSPFHERTSALCHSYRWKEWGGYYTVCSYDTCHEREYFAFRHAVGMIDVTPLYKYEVTGKDAADYLTRIMSKDIRKLKLGQVTYLCWCDDDGKVMDDGTVTRLDETHFRVTAAEPSYHWFMQFTRGYEVQVEESTDKLAALSVQGPNARGLLSQICDADLDGLRFFRSTPAKFDGFGGVITRTGYTGDLGYEVWVDSADALKLWDALIANGKAYGLEPCGLDAMDVTRLEAGFIMNGVDYYSANHCPIESRKSSPYEISLGWTVQLDREAFNGQEALRREKEKGSIWQTVGLEIDWDELERLYYKKDLPPQLPNAAWRTAIPIYNQAHEQIGYATSGTWSPTLKKNICLATIETPYSAIDTKVQIEQTVEFERKTVTATVRKMPFLDLERKCSIIKPNEMPEAKESGSKESGSSWQATQPTEQNQTATMQ